MYFLCKNTALSTTCFSFIKVTSPRAKQGKDCVSSREQVAFHLPTAELQDLNKQQPPIEMNMQQETPSMFSVVKRNTLMPVWVSKASTFLLASALVTGFRMCSRAVSGQREVTVPFILHPQAITPQQHHEQAAAHVRTAEPASKASQILGSELGDLKKKKTNSALFCLCRILSKHPSFAFRATKKPLLLSNPWNFAWEAEYRNCYAGLAAEQLYVYICMGRAGEETSSGKAENTYKWKRTAS